MGSLVVKVDYLFNKIFTPRYNPLYHLGTIAIFLLALLIVTGIYILLFYKINVERAYGAVEYITKDQWYLGGIMRSVHRYAADALVITLLLHGVRLFLTGKFRFNRWLIWISGAGLFVFILIEGISGYWMVWDERAQLIATATTEFLDSLPIFPKPLARAVMSEAAVTNLLFFAVIFVHVGGPLLLAAMLWLHFSRISRPVLTPPRAIWAAIFLAMLALSLLKPAISAPPADLMQVPVNVPVDWLYMFLFPLFSSAPGWSLWFLFGALAVLVSALPWIKSAAKPQEARVIAENCVGCTLCYNDCPYDAITMLRKNGKSIAEISASRCAACGTCLGACNFKAIELDKWNDEKIKAQISRLLSMRIYCGFSSTPATGKPVLALLCERSVSSDVLSEIADMKDVRALVLRCGGMINPGVIKHALDSGASGIFISGCKIGDCYYRFGNRWLLERLNGERAPIFKDRRAEKVRSFWTSPAEKILPSEIRKFQENLSTGALKPEVQERFSKAMIIPALAILLLPTLLIGYLSDTPAYSPIEESEAVLLFTMKHRGELVEPCEESTMEELRIGIIKECKRERVPVYVEVYVDGEVALSNKYNPRGIRKDEPSYAYEKIRLASSTHTIKIRMRDTREEKFSRTFEQSINFEPRRIVILEFDDVYTAFRVS